MAAGVPTQFTRRPAIVVMGFGVFALSFQSEDSYPARYARGPAAKAEA